MRVASIAHKNSHVMYLVSACKTDDAFKTPCVCATVDFKAYPACHSMTSCEVLCQPCSDSHLNHGYEDNDTILQHVFLLGNLTSKRLCNQVQMKLQSGYRKRWSSMSKLHSSSGKADSRTEKLQSKSMQATVKDKESCRPAPTTHTSHDRH